MFYTLSISPDTLPNKKNLGYILFGLTAVTISLDDIPAEQFSFVRDHPPLSIPLSRSARTAPHPRWCGGQPPEADRSSPATFHLIPPCRAFPISGLDKEGLVS